MPKFEYLSKIKETPKTFCKNNIKLKRNGEHSMTAKWHLNKYGRGFVIIRGRFSHPLPQMSCPVLSQHEVCVYMFSQRPETVTYLL